MLKSNYFRKSLAYLNGHSMTITNDHTQMCMIHLENIEKFYEKLFINIKYFPDI